MSQQPKNTWDLENLLQNKTLDDLFYDFVRLENELIEQYKTFLDTKQNFINFLKKDEEIVKINNRLENYISNKGQEDMSNPLWIGWMQKIITKKMEFAKIFSNYENIVIENENKINEYLKDESIFEYQRMFDMIFRFKNHVLSKENELLFSQLSINDQSVSDIYSTLTDNDLSYADAMDSNGNIVKIETQSDIFKNLKSKDETLRKTSWYSFHKAYYQFRNTLTKTLYYNYLMLNTNARIRNFDDYIDSVAFSDEVDKNFIQTLYKNVKLYKPLIAKYQKSRNNFLKYLLNKQKLMPWDMNVELCHDTRTYTWEEIKKIAYDSLSILGQDYQKLVQRAFDENWISYLPSPNKHTGAYSIGGTKGLDKYYILMNFDSTIQSAFTLVHELGHSINSYFYGKKQKIYQDTKIFYAEIASITNEMILSHYLLNDNKIDQNARLLILDEMISGFFNTTSRQIIFSNLEWIMNDWVKNGEQFTYEKISKEYYELMTQYLNIDKTFEEYNSDPYLYALITPLRISHFYAGNFYVYKYAVGQIAAIIIADEIIKNKNDAKEKLFNFLSSGTSLSPLKTIELLGIDLTKQDPYKKAQEILTNWINEFSELVNKILPKN